MTSTTAQDILASAIRIDNDVNGNPRYYTPVYMWPRMTDVTRLKAGLTTYRGKRYGAGYVIHSYSLASDIAFAIKVIEA